MMMIGNNDDDDDPHPSLQLIDLYISSIVTNISNHVLSSVALAIAQLIPITTVIRKIDGDSGAYSIQEVLS